MYDYIVLKMLHNQNALNSTFCMSIGQIKANIDKLRQSSVKTLRRSLKELMDKEYIKEGQRDGKYKRYYITKKGQQMLEEIKNGTD